MIDRVQLGQIIVFPEFIDITPILSVFNKYIPASVKLEHLHKSYDGKKLTELNDNISHDIKPVAQDIVYNFVRNTLQVDDPFYIDNGPVIRFFTPYDYWYDEIRPNNKKPGYLTIQGPHQDNWFGHSTTGMNMWMAVGHVQKGNGLLIYPDLWGQTISHKGKYRIPRDQALGKPINFTLSPGDMIFFHGEHMHSSEINVTDETRVVLTCRFSLVSPSFTEGGNSAWITSSDYENRGK